MDLLLGATEDPVEGRAQHDHPAPAGRTGAFPLHAVRPQEQGVAVCGAAVRRIVDGTWPPGAEAQCADCAAALDAGGNRPTPRDDATLRQVSPFGQP